MSPHLPDLPLPALSTLLLAATPLLLAAMLHFVVIRVLHSRSTLIAHLPDTEQHEGHENRARVWLAHLLQTASGPIALIIWMLAIHFTTTTLLDGSHTPRRLAVVTALQWIRGAVVFLALLWLLLRVGKVIEIRLTALARRTPSLADDFVLPLVGRGIRVVLPLMAV